jgi:hypothetical protein
MKKRLLYAGLATCVFFAVSAVAQDGTSRATVRPSVGTIKGISGSKLKLPPPISKIVVEVKTGGDDFRPGSSIAQQLVRPDGRSEPSGNLRYWEISEGSYGYSSARQSLGIGAGETKKYFIDLPRPMTLPELRAYSLKLTFDGAPRNTVDSYDNWNIDHILVYTQGVCPGIEGIDIAQVGRPRSQQTNWRRMSGENRKEIIPMRITGDAGNERVTKLEAEIETGGDDLRGGAVATAIVRLVDGTEYPAVSLNRGEGWGGGSIKKVDINLPSPTLLSAIDFIEIGFDGAGRNFGEGYDNWDIQKIIISSMEACRTHHLFLQKGTPWWRASANDNQKTLYFARE